MAKKLTSASKTVSKAISNKGFSGPILIMGIFLAALFAASNAYAGLKAGLTVAAGIPGTILGAGFVSAFAKKKGIYGVNVLQSMSSGGEINSTNVFIIPAVILVASASGFNPLEAAIATGSGAILGAGVMFVLHNYFIETPHEDMLYPESMAISESMKATTSGGEPLKLMGVGAAIAAIVTSLSSQVFGLFQDTISIVGPAAYKFRFKIEANPMLLGLGFIIGMEVALPMFASSIFGNFAILPLISYFASMADHTTSVWNSTTKMLYSMNADGLGTTYLRYIGAGMMIYGGIIGAAKLVPMIIKSVKDTVRDLKKAGGASDGENSKMKLVLLVVGVGIVFFVSLFICQFDMPLAIIAALLTVVIALLFSIVGARLTGMVGCSNAPVSGMLIASVVLISLVFLMLGKTSNNDNMILLFLTTAVCGGICYSNGYVQSSKASSLIGGSKSEIQKMFTLAYVVGIIVVVGTVAVLAPAIADGKSFQAPQANLIASLTQGLFQGALPWSMVITGIILGLVMHLLGVPIMMAALGLYLPIETVLIMFVGAVLRYLIVDIPSRSAKSQKEKKVLETRSIHGVSLSSGLVAGGSIFGLLGVMLQVSGVIGAPPDILPGGNLSATIMLAILVIVSALPIRYWKTNK
ncbi:MAG: oligopeptide transporter, OPT family [Bifidobacteriaceae bacterium]|jgi:putative OPT family oligopeptide transporter|nr:oligopeptide transporter, OPT family [Bifidobacteriaceae bacterium]